MGRRERTLGDRRGSVGRVECKEVRPATESPVSGTRSGDPSPGLDPESTGGGPVVWEDRGSGRRVRPRLRLPELGPGCSLRTTARSAWVSGPGSRAPDSTVRCVSGNTRTSHGGARGPGRWAEGREEGRSRVPGRRVVGADEIPDTTPPPESTPTTLVPPILPSLGWVPSRDPSEAPQGKPPQVGDGGRRQTGTRRPSHTRLPRGLVCPGPGGWVGSYPPLETGSGGCGVLPIGTGRPGKEGSPLVPGARPHRPSTERTPDLLPGFY